MNQPDGTETTAGPRTTRLLVVEDDGVVARDVRTSLEEMGYDVPDVVPKGEWALNAAREHRPDMVLMDIRLAGDLDGVEAGRAILAELDIPVVYLTAYADDETRSRARETSPFGYVVKPFTDRDLRTTVEVALLRHRLERELEEERARLAERVKEQSCLYDVSRILHADDRPLDERLQAVVDRLPGGWQHPEMTVARLHLEDEVYRTDEFPGTESSLRAPVEVAGEHLGEIEVAYREELPAEDVGPFLAEESRLLDEVAGRLASELRRIEVEEQRRRLADIVESTSDFVVMTDAGGRTLWMNRPGREMLGIPEDEDVQGLPLSAHFSDDAARTIVEEALPAASEEGVWRGETALETRRGDEIPVSQVVVAHGDDVGEVAYYSTIARDVTERREARQESERQRRTLSRILEAAAEGIVLADADGAIRFANPAAADILGVEAEEIAGRSCVDPRWEVTGTDGAPFPDDRLPVGRVLRDEASVRHVEYGVVRPDGSRVLLSVNAEPLTDAEGTLTGVVASIRDVTQQKEFEAQLEERALHDYLTGLPNRALFRDRLEHALNRTRRFGEGLAVLFVDLKRFKLVNDSLGHEAGDQVLREVAARLEEVVRAPDTVARLGGDEFVVLLEDVEDEADAVDVAERLVDIFRTPISVDGREVRMEASVGVIVHGRDRTKDMDASELVRRADAAMYQAKEMPGTRYTVADPADEPGPSARLERETRLREALEEGGIRTVYQPIYSIGSRAIRGVEALARWRDPELGEVSPGTFIPIAEETGLIIQLGEQQLERACSQLLEDGFTGPVPDAPLRLHVNLSARQLDDPDVVERTRRILRETGYPPARLCLEITESAAMRQAETVERLKEIGVELAIDDFGTRYSTLSQVRRLQVDSLKIDRTFVDGLPDDEKDRAIVETILTLGRALGLTVVAEGIETARQLELLEGLGCDEAQGFHLARPCPPDEFRELLAGETDR